MGDVIKNAGWRYNKKIKEMMNFIWVAIGGALGSVMRYACSLGVAHYAWHPTLATLLVNVLGSLLIGVLMGMNVKGAWQQLGTVGFCGGFTTFSTFSAQTLAWLQKGEWAQAGGYVGVTLVVCLLATWMGLLIGQKITR